MCGRYTLKTSAAELADYFCLHLEPDWSPRYNIAPSQYVPVLVARAPAAAPLWRSMVWGLVPSWAKDPTVGGRLINARSETARDKPAFRTALRRRRCVLPADGFYEWMRTPGGKQPYYIARRDCAPFGLAGLWETWQSPDGTEIDSCTILTTVANTVVAPIHHRMPVMLSRGACRSWMDPSVEDSKQVTALLSGFLAMDLIHRVVGRTVNRVSNDSPQCLEADGQGELF